MKKALLLEARIAGGGFEPPTFGLWGQTLATQESARYNEGQYPQGYSYFAFGSPGFVCAGVPAQSQHSEECVLQVMKARPVDLMGKRRATYGVIRERFTSTLATTREP